MKVISGILLFVIAAALGYALRWVWKWMQE